MSEEVQPMSSTSPTNSFEFAVTFQLKLIPDVDRDNASMLGMSNFSSYYLQLYNRIGLVMRSLAIPISFIGIVTNSINLAVFSRLMNNDTVSISLFGMSLSDFLVCLTSQLGAITEFQEVHDFLLFYLSINTRQMVYYCIIFPNLHFARVTIIISAFITLERCLCVAMPLKVKSIFTSGRVKLIIFLCFVLGLSTGIPYYSTYYFTWTFYPPLNRTILGYTSVEGYKDIIGIAGPFIIVFVYVFLFALIVVCTTILIVVLNKKMSWRKGATSTVATTSGQVSMKELKVIKMMVIVSLLFIACNTPVTGVYLVNGIDSSVSMEGSSRFLFFLLGAFAIVIQTFNSTVTIFIYYFNSTNYKNMFHKIFGIEKKDRAKSGS